MKTWQIVAIIVIIAIEIGFLFALVNYNYKHQRSIEAKNKKIIDTAENLIDAFKDGYKVDVIKGYVDSPSVVIPVSLTEFLIKVRECKSTVYYNFKIRNSTIYASNTYCFYIFNSAMTVAYKFVISEQNIDDVGVSAPR